MCFYIPERQIKAKRATKDIPCLKKMRDRGEKEWTSMHFKFIYKNGYEYTEDSFEKLRRKYNKCYYSRAREATRNGFHSFMPNSEEAINYPIGKLVECYIPKGAYYFSNLGNHTYFSDRIVIVGAVKPS